MQCPTCTKEFHVQPDNSQYYFFSEQDEDAEFESGFGFAVQLCPSCSNIVVMYREGEVSELSGECRLRKIKEEKAIYPQSTGKLLPEEIPQEYREELKEAYLVLPLSPKASAALSRRLLQKIFHLELKIKKRNLSDEIDVFIASSDVPTYLSEAVDAIRTVGNFAAHPLKNSHSGEIVDVEDGESEWLIEVLEALLDYVFVQPRKLKARKDKLNEKLEQMGKPPLKGS
ncbi:MULTISPECIES: DUF4145 domain-containing protein [Alteromonas]|jgi:hypothetical protein|nr:MULTISPECIES: DUF4145 domain-containing protein [Alteromonas]MCG7649933.1 DUF4145 domain-containing protein [Alteromonas sp. MmMcT2-5]|tara:strand:+ start:983 stop:1666 length:684 start_codon:yes stop_codon:yes gene_type:complete